MIFIIDSQGNIINTVPESVYQGSNNANTIVLAGPISPYTSVTAAFKLPFNLTTTEMVMTPGGKFNGPEDLDVDWYYWTLSVPDTVTAYAGKVEVQFKCYNTSSSVKVTVTEFSASQVVATATGGFIVQPGVAPEEPPEPSSDDFYQQILSALSAKQSSTDPLLNTTDKTVVGAINGLNGEVQALETNKQDATDENLETTAKTVVGAINEVNGEVQALETDKQDKTDQSLETTAKTVVGAINEVNTAAEDAVSTAEAAKLTAEGIAGTANTALQNANEAVATANQAAQTANDIAGTADEAKQIAQAAQTTAQTAQTTANEAKSIAQGRAQAKVFDTVEDMNAWLAIPANTATLNVGDNIYIRAESAPDYWWDGTQAVEMETDVDLTDVYTKEEADTKFVAQVPGKGLSSNDFTTAEKNKLAGLSNYTLPQATTTTLGGVQLAAASGQSESLVMTQKAVTDYVAAQIASAITTALNANY